MLAVHSTNPRLGVALCHFNRVLYEKVLEPGKEHLENLAPLIQEITQMSGYTIPQIDLYAAAIGPGSFSGIRIGLAAVKGMALCLRKPAIGISSLDALAWDGLHTGETGLIAIDARRQEAYVVINTKQTYGLDRLSEPMLINQAEIASLMSAYPQVSTIIGDPLPTLGNQKENFREGRISPSACAQLAVFQFESGIAGDCHSLLPSYLRKSDAEEKKKLKDKSGVAV